ncbi:hypothetical protein ED208_06900 [Stagnimonas aquatica]|uniref:Uncharacterized protein n=1 Tax=Stagnimonas aquatica TaxID=2689987 RepID=A0A3N0VHF2_9GAMM|nr:hypothetical protein [Stagnimonas aquatica]ROH92090.1 hypothetical protein ED208_06900 [Stagnimonas aquatica]
MISPRNLVAVSSWLLSGVVLADPAPTSPATTAPTASTAEPAPATKPLLQWNLKSATQAPAGSVLLPEVKVTGHRDAFQEADEKLRRAAAALPCTGCGGNTAQEKVGVVEKVLTGAAEVLKQQFVAADDAAEPATIKDRAEAEAAARPLFRPGQDP